jgi:hypothetical protein
LPGGCRVARLEGVDFAEAHRINAEFFGNTLHVHFDRKLRLRRTKSAERTVWWRVGAHRAAADSDMGAAIRPRRMQHATRQHHGTQRAVRPAIEQNIDLHRGESPVTAHAGAMADDRRVSLGRREHVFHAVVHQLHGPARLAREDRGMTGDVRRVLLFAAEAASRLGLNDADFLVG